MNAGRPGIQSGSLTGFNTTFVKIQHCLTFRNLKERDNFENTGVDGRTILRRNLQWKCRVQTRLLWLGIGTRSGLLPKRS
jgi:hypothetical protein